MARKVSDEDKQRAQGLFALGKSFREIAKELDGRVSPAWISKAARDEGWLRGVLPAKLVTPTNPQIFESANATPGEMSANTDKLKEASRRRWTEHKSELADEFGERISELLERAFAPCVLKEQKVVGLGGGVQEVRLVETELKLPPPADQVKLLTGVAILVDKASLLVGDATSRVETSALNRGQAVDRLEHIKNEFEDRRQKNEAAAAKRAQAAG
jgi:hypothetical protein